MKAELISKYGTWRDVADRARNTIGKEAGQGEPSSEWKRRMLLCEHSPIRVISLTMRLRDLLSWVSVHFVRHHKGIEHFVSTQRTDRTGVDRSELSQAELVRHEMLLNPQAMIAISRKRLCRCASPETQAAWRAVVIEVSKTEPELAAACVPDCIYRGHCYEYKSCGYHHTSTFQAQLEDYRRGINA